LTKRTAWLTGAGDRVALRLSPLDGTISFHSLRHKVPKKAQTAFRAAVKAASAGDLEEGIRLFQIAITVDPQFPEAHANLAVQYSALGHEDRALHHAQIAFDLDPASPEIALTLAMLLTDGKRYEEAEAIDRRILKTWRDMPEVEQH